MRKAAVLRDSQKSQQSHLTNSNSNNNKNISSWPKRKLLAIWYAVKDLLQNPKYAIPLLLNVTGSVWFFLLIGQAGMLLFFLFFFPFVSSSVIPLSFGGGFVETNTNTSKNKKSLAGLNFDTTELTDYGTIWNRIEFNGTHYKLIGIFIYSVGGMVGGWKGDFER